MIARPRQVLVDAEVFRDVCGYAVQRLEALAAKCDKPLGFGADWADSERERVQTALANAEAQAKEQS